MHHCSFGPPTLTERTRRVELKKLNYEWLRKKGNRNKAIKEQKKVTAFIKNKKKIKNVCKAVPARHLTTLNDVSKWLECMM